MKKAQKKVIKTLQNKDIYKVVITGGIAAGKSLVSAKLIELGACLIDCDLTARQVVEPGQPAYNKIVETWGKDILLPDGGLDRKKMGSIIFSKAEEREKLNSITHPAIIMEISKSIEKSSSPIVFIDVPLYFETRRIIPCQEVWLVYCPFEIQLQRLINRDKISKTEALRRIGSQLPIDDKRDLANVIIDNSKDILWTEKQTEEYYKRLIENRN